MAPAAPCSYRIHQRRRSDEGEMTDLCNLAIVLGWLQEAHASTQRMDYERDFVEGRGRGFSRGGQAVDAVSEERGIGSFDAADLFASHRMTSDEIEIAGQEFLCPANHLAFRAGDIGNHRAGRGHG